VTTQKHNKNGSQVTEAEMRETDENNRENRAVQSGITGETQPVNYAVTTPDICPSHTRLY